MSRLNRRFLFSIFLSLSLLVVSMAYVVTAKADATPTFTPTKSPTLSVGTPIYVTPTYLTKVPGCVVGYPTGWGTTTPGVPWLQACGACLGSLTPGYSTWTFPATWTGAGGPTATNTVSPTSTRTVTPGPTAVPGLIRVSTLFTFGGAPYYSANGYCRNNTTGAVFSWADTTARDVMDGYDITCHQIVNVGAGGTYYAAYSGWTFKTVSGSGVVKFSIFETNTNMAAIANVNPCISIGFPGTVPGCQSTVAISTGIQYLTVGWTTHAGRSDFITEDMNISWNGSGAFQSTWTPSPTYNFTPNAVQPYCGTVDGTNGYDWASMMPQPLYGPSVCQAFGVSGWVALMNAGWRSLISLLNFLGGTFGEPVEMPLPDDVTFCLQPYQFGSWNALGVSVSLDTIFVLLFSAVLLFLFMIS